MAWIGAVVQGAAALYGAYQQNKANNQSNSINNLQVNTAKGLQGPGLALLNEGQQLGEPATRRLLSLASGNRTDIQQALAPEIEDINARSNEQQRVASELDGRGGGRAQLLASEPYRKLNTLNRLYFGARDTANANLLQLASDKTRLGIGALGSALGGLQGAAASSLALHRQQYQESQDTGASLADAWNQFYSWYSTRGSSGSGSPGPSTQP